MPPALEKSLSNQNFIELLLNFSQVFIHLVDLCTLKFFYDTRYCSPTAVPRLTTPPPLRSQPGHRRHSSIPNFTSPLLLRSYKCQIRHALLEKRQPCSSDCRGLQDTPTRSLITLPTLAKGVGGAAVQISF